MPVLFRQTTYNLLSENPAKRGVLDPPFGGTRKFDRGKARTVTDFELSGRENPMNRKRLRIQTALASIGQARARSSEIDGLVEVDSFGAPVRPYRRSWRFTSR
jgi:hypothetical protein